MCESSLDTFEQANCKEIFVIMAECLSNGQNR